MKGKFTLDNNVSFPVISREDQREPNPEALDWAAALADKGGGLNDELDETVDDVIRDQMPGDLSEQALAGLESLPPDIRDQILTTMQKIREETIQPPPTVASEMIRIQKLKVKQNQMIKPTPDTLKENDDMENDTPKKKTAKNNPNLFIRIAEANGEKRAQVDYMTGPPSIDEPLAQKIQDAFGPSTGIYESFSPEDISIDYGEHLQGDDDFGVPPGKGLGDWIATQIHTEQIMMERDGASASEIKDWTQRVVSKIRDEFGIDLKRNKKGVWNARTASYVEPWEDDTDPIEKEMQSLQRMRKDRWKEDQSAAWQLKQMVGKDEVEKKANDFVDKLRAWLNETPEVVPSSPRKPRREINPDILMPGLNPRSNSNNRFVKLAQSDGPWYYEGPPPESDGPTITNRKRNEGGNGPWYYEGPPPESDGPTITQQEDTLDQMLSDPQIAQRWKEMINSYPPRIQPLIERIMLSQFDRTYQVSDTRLGKALLEINPDASYEEIQQAISEIYEFVNEVNDLAYEKMARSNNRFVKLSQFDEYDEAFQPEPPYSRWTPEEEAAGSGRGGGDHLWETPETAGSSVVFQDEEILVIKNEDGIFELFGRSDDHAGYTIRVNGMGYEFMRNISPEEIADLTGGQPAADQMPATWANSKRSNNRFAQIGSGPANIEDFIGQHSSTMLLRTLDLIKEALNKKPDDAALNIAREKIVRVLESRKEPKQAMGKNAGVKELLEMLGVKTAPDDCPKEQKSVMQDLREQLESGGITLDPNSKWKGKPLPPKIRDMNSM